MHAHLAVQCAETMLKHIQFSLFIVSWFTPEKFLDRKPGQGSATMRTVRIFCVVLLCSLAGVHSLIILPHFCNSLVQSSNGMLPISQVFACQGKNRRRAEAHKRIVSMRSFPALEDGIKLLFPSSLSAGQGFYGYMTTMARDCPAILARTAVEWAADSLTLLAAGLAAVLLGAFVMM